MKKTLFAAALCFLAVFACKKKNSANNTTTVDCSTINATYSASVKPIIQANCLSSGCHNSGSSNGDLSTYAGLKTKVDNGSVNNRVIVSKNMPPAGLSTDDLNKIKCWLDSGSPNN